MEGYPSHSLCQMDNYQRMECGLTLIGSPLFLLNSGPLIHTFPLGLTNLVGKIVIAQNNIWSSAPQKTYLCTGFKLFQKLAFIL